MRLEDVARVSAAVAATPARGAKIELLASFLRSASPDELAIVVSWLTGALTQRQIGVGWASLRDPPAPAARATLTVGEVERRLTDLGAMSGPGSQTRRRDSVAELFAAASAPEQDFLRRVLGGELRQGALVGVMTDAVAQAAKVPLADVRRASMLGGALPSVAVSALYGGAAALAAFHLQVGRPVSPMLAQPTDGVADALRRLGTAAWEWKLDGVRIQVHRRHREVLIVTRTLDDITTRLPEVVEAVLALPADTLVADGEAVALRADGRPEPFQVTAARLGTRTSTPTPGRTVPVTPFLFDLLHRDGTDLLDRRTDERFRQLDELVPASLRVPRLVTGSATQAEEFLAAALARGHEGVIAKALDARYEAGRRGGSWLKIKPVHTLDLVVLAVEWGSGRRRGWLSNIHLGARDPRGGFIMLGKTFKGMTDSMLAWQTERFQELAQGPTQGWVLTLRPEQVVEIAFDGVQRSSRYPGGVALRFARVVRYREDKSAEQADTIDTVRALHAD